MDGEGVDPDVLEDTIARARPKLVYLIPTLHCPTGRVMGSERRRRIIEICTRFRTPIVESHVYGDLTFAKPPPTLKSLDTSGIVILQGSASKTIGAALRLGWLIAPRRAMEVLTPAKVSLDLSTPTLPQAILASFLETGAYARHLTVFRAELQARRDALVSALARHCPELHYASPQGGLYLWARLPSHLQGSAVEAAAQNEGVSIRDGSAFHPNGGTSTFIRLCYAAPALDEIEIGAGRLGNAMRSLLERSGSRAAEISGIAPV
jgi:GntR family transcriptional regulator of abcA and norABC